jgi:hypothetical protein
VAYIMVITKCNFQNIYLGYFDKHECKCIISTALTFVKNKQIKSLLIFISNFHASFMTTDGLFLVEYVFK